MASPLYMLLTATQNDFQKVTKRKAIQMGLLPGQPKVLEYLYAHGRCSQTEIGAAWHLEKSTVSELVKSLKEQGLIRCETSAEDRRRQELTLTEEGLRLWMPMEAVLTELEQRTWSGIDEERKETFLEVFGRIAQNMSQIKQGGV